MKHYRVTSPRRFLDHEPGEAFTATLDPDQESRALRRCSIEVLGDAIPQLSEAEEAEFAGHFGSGGSVTLPTGTRVQPTGDTNFTQGQQPDGEENKPSEGRSRPLFGKFGSNGADDQSRSK